MRRDVVSAPDAPHARGSLRTSFARFVRLAVAHVRIAGRRRSLWKATVPLALLSVVFAAMSQISLWRDGVEALAYLGQVFVLFCVLAYAAAFTDLFTGTRRGSLGEVEAACPWGGATLGAARLVGSFVVAVAPPLAALLAVGAMQVTQGNAWAPLQALAVGALIVAPAVLVALGISGLFGALLPRAAARIAGLATWCLAVFTGPKMGLPTLNGTVLNVVGDAVTTGVFGARPVSQPFGPLAFDGSVGAAVVSLVWEALLVALLVAAGSVAAHHRACR